jgi:hypothetical protein
VSSLVTTRAIHIVDERTLEDRLESTSDEVMYYSIAEVTREYLSLYRISHDKSGAWTKCISPTLYLFPELDAFRLIIELEFESSIGVSLMLPTVIVGSKDVIEGKHDPKNILINC